VRRFWRRSDEHSLDARVRRARPEPTREFLESRIEWIRGDRGRRPAPFLVRYGFSVVLVAALGGALALAGGIGYARSGAVEAIDAVRPGSSRGPRRARSRRARSSTSARAAARSIPTNPRIQRRMRAAPWPRATARHRRVPRGRRPACRYRSWTTCPRRRSPSTTSHRTAPPRQRRLHARLRQADLLGR
jgi:hypothetical protein